MFQHVPHLFFFVGLRRKIMYVRKMYPSSFKEKIIHNKKKDEMIKKKWEKVLKKLLEEKQF